MNNHAEELQNEACKAQADVSKVGKNNLGRRFTDSAQSKVIVYCYDEITVFQVSHYALAPIQGGCFFIMTIPQFPHAILIHIRDRLSSSFLLFYWLTKAKG